MRRWIDWRRHPVLGASAAAIAALLVFEVGGAAAAAALLALVLLLLSHLGWLGASRRPQVLSVRVPGGGDLETALAALLWRHTDLADLTDACSLPGGGADLTYTVRLRRGHTTRSLQAGIDGLIYSHAGET